MVEDVMVNPDAEWAEWDDKAEWDKDEKRDEGLMRKKDERE